MQSTIAKAIFNSHSYLEYRKLVYDLLRDNISTGDEQSESLALASSLNETRMNLLEKTLQLSDEMIVRLKSLKRHYIWLVISEGWCEDAAHLLPVFYKMAEASEGNIDLKIVLRDDNKDLMHFFLTNKKPSIPKLILINKETGRALAHWGPQPKGAADLVDAYKKEHGVFDEKIQAELLLWYLHDKGITAQSEIIDMMLDLDADSGF